MGRRTGGIRQARRLGFWTPRSERGGRTWRQRLASREPALSAIGSAGELAPPEVCRKEHVHCAQDERAREDGGVRPREREPGSRIDLARLAAGQHSGSRRGTGERRNRTRVGRGSERGARVLAAEKTEAAASSGTHSALTEGEVHE